MLRRLRSRHQADAMLQEDVDPYRTAVDTNVPMLVALVVVGVLVLALFGVRPGL